MAVAQENRIRKRMIEDGQRRSDVMRQIEAAHMIRAPRKPSVPPQAAARRREHAQRVSGRSEFALLASILEEL